MPCLAALALLAVRASGGEFFPFVLPWNDASPGPTNVSAWLDKPAGGRGFVVVKDGHLFSGGKRVRLFGANLCFGANFPKKEDAVIIAARMAKFGINCVRFHHMDNQSAPSGIWAKDMRTLDPDQLDRLDYFIAELKKHGIYSDLNLHVSRVYPDRPKAEKTGNPNYDKGVDFFSAPMLELQRQFARDLLTHVNPYTGNAYTAEPAIALIEINNENALLDEWHNGGLDDIATPYRAELGALWTAWLRQRHGSDEKLRGRWAENSREAGPELLKNGDFSKALSGWYLEHHEGAVARADTADGILRIDVQKPGKQSWHVQIGQAGLALKAGETYAVSFRAMSDARRRIAVSIAQAHPPWQPLGSREVWLEPEWKEFSVIVPSGAGDENARMTLTNLAREVAHFEFANVSLRTAAIDGTVPGSLDRGVAAFTRDDYAGRAESAQKDWSDFLWSLEEKYWRGMRDFIRKDLGAKSLIIGTQLGWSPFPLQQELDVIDAHSYWHHPHFPRKQWDMGDWTVKNEQMAGAANGGTLRALALGRVVGKPYIVSEYNHSAPNTFSAETFPLICAFAALQDWDGVFAFSYSHRRDNWDLRHFNSFFDIDQHPVKMATLPASVAMFLRGDVSPAPGSIIGRFQLETAKLETRKRGPRWDGERVGVKWEDALTHRVGVQLGDSSNIVRTGKGEQKELKWDAAQRVVTVDAAKSKGVIGAAKGREFDLGGVRIATGAEFAVIQATVMEGEDFANAKRILVTATASAENTEMKWQDAAKTTLGRNWGKAPSLAEGFAATIKLPGDRKLRAWALDELGQRRDEIPMNGGTLQIGPQHRTVWYEVAAE